MVNFWRLGYFGIHFALVKPNVKILFSGDHSYNKRRDTTRKRTFSSVNNKETCNLVLDNPGSEEITGGCVDIVAISECVESTYKHVEMDLGIFEDLENNLMMNLFDDVVV